jgi:four helix bundle protein
MENVANKEFYEKMQMRTKLALNKQLLRSATLVITNYKAACKARSKAEYFSKIRIAAKEAGEAQFWIEMLIDSGLAEDEKIKILHNEISEIVAITASIKKLSARAGEKVI